MANWFDQYFGFAPKANEQDGVWSFGIPQGQAPDVPLWPSPQMPPQSDDPFERAAQRTRQSVQPQGGRTEGMATTLPEDFLIPKTPLDYAMYATMGPFRLPAKALMLGVGAAMNPETAEAGPLSKVVGGAARGGVWSDLAKTTHRPVEEMSATRVPTGSLQPFKSLDPAALQGSVLTPAVGDRTAAGSILTHVNDLPLSRPVTLEGGPDFMRSAANTHDGAVWASEKAAASKMANLGRTLGADGKDVNLVYSAMGARSGDYSHMTADALLGQLGNAPITRDATATFNAAMRAQNPTWPGLKSPALRDTLMNDPAMRVQFVHEMALGQHQTAGFPDIASTRAAISEPALLGQPTGVSGYAISRLGPQSKMIEAPSVPHSTYSTQVQGGEYRGGLSTPIPREMMFPAFFEQRRAAGAPKLADDRAFTMGNVSQDATQQWLDTISQYIEQQKLLGR